jgi:DNA invertase Pin-like site-specific DNA recombinase
MTKDVIELIRVSTESQAAEDRAGIPAQRAVNRKTTAQFGLNIVRSIEISDVSGAAVLQAPEIQELLRLIESPQIHGVVAKEFSRLMRPENFSDYVLLQAFAETNTILYLPEGPIDLSSKGGRFLGAIRAAVAGLERSEILERMWLAKEEKRRRGENPQSVITLPTGVMFDRSSGRWLYTADSEKVKRAFEMFLSGNTSYTDIGTKLGIDAPSLKVMLRNPIYCGWRVISQKRDPSPRAHKVKPDGRQADRPKINRNPDEVIRIKVIEQPLVSEDDFRRAQEIMATKRLKHWRAHPEQHQRWTYNGFLTCAICQNLVYTKFYRGRDYYVCKARREGQGCVAPYMRRVELEEKLDEVFEKHLTDKTFLRDIADGHLNGTAKDEQDLKIEKARSELERLSKKRDRVLDSYFEGILSREERDRRLQEVDRDLRTYRQWLSEQAPLSAFSADALAEIFSVFSEWKFLKRDEKRKLLSCLVPEIRVADYNIYGISLMSATLRGDENNHNRAVITAQDSGSASARKP